MTLYNLTEQYKQLLAMAEDDGIDMAAFADTLEAIEGEIEDKLDNYAVIINSMSTDVDQIKAEENRLANMRRSIEQKQKKMKQVMLYMMTTTNAKKIKTDRYTFTVAKNPETLVIDDPYLENYPIEYLIPQDPTLDKAKLKADLKAGKDVGGLAHLEHTSSVRIR